VPADNFFEWKKTATGKQPYVIALADRRLMALAGLWENWRSPAGEWVRSFAIITTTPNELCAALHNRMPVVLRPETWSVWLGEEPTDASALKALLAPFPSEEMTCWPVSTRVGNLKNNDPSLIEPLREAGTHTRREPRQRRVPDPPPMPLGSGAEQASYRCQTGAVRWVCQANSGCRLIDPNQPIVDADSQGSSCAGFWTPVITRL
jgi:hypothetical protein